MRLHDAARAPDFFSARAVARPTWRLGFVGASGGIERVDFALHGLLMDVSLLVMGV